MGEVVKFREDERLRWLTEDVCADITNEQRMGR